MAGTDSKFAKKGSRTGALPAGKTALLLVLGGFALLAIIYAKITRRQAGPVNAVTSVSEDKLKSTVACPICKKRFASDEFVDNSVPNMRNCPNCNHQIPLPYLLRQRLK